MQWDVWFTRTALKLEFQNAHELSCDQLQLMTQASQSMQTPMNHSRFVARRLNVGFAKLTLRTLKLLVTWQIAWHNSELKKSCTRRVPLLAAKYVSAMVILKLYLIGSQLLRLVLNNLPVTCTVEARIHVLNQHGTCLSVLRMF